MFNRPASHRPAPNGPAKIFPLCALCVLLFNLSFTLALSAQDVPLRWDIETSRPANWDLTIYRDESLLLQPRFLSYGDAVDLSGATNIVLQYWSADMTNGYTYGTNGTLVGSVTGRVQVAWDHTCEGHTNRYSYVLRVDGAGGRVRRGFGTITLKGTALLPSTNAPRYTYALDDLSDVAITNAADNQVLTYDAALGRWVNRPAQGGSGTATNVTAAAVSYSGAYANVQDALDALLYVAPTVSLSGGAVYDIGRTITNVSLSWTVNKTMTVREISGGETIRLEAGGSGSYTITNALDSSQTLYTLSVSDGTTTASSSTYNYFRHRRYWGYSSNSVLTDAQVQALTSELATARTTSKTGLTPTGNQYLWMCYPTSWGDGYFILGGYPTVFTVTTNSFTNAYGHAESFILNRSPNLIGYTTTLEVQ